MSTVRVVPATITIGTSTTISAAIDVREGVVVGLEMPATLTGTALTFLSSSDSAGTYQAVTKVDGTPYTVVVASAKNVTIPWTDLNGFRFLKLVSGTAELADRTINVMVRNFD